jgi:putative FmdB family regulatory protein
MPLYDFQCEYCDEVFEVRASIRDKEAGLKLECPKCHRQKTRQVITADW